MLSRVVWLCGVLLLGACVDNKQVRTDPTPCRSGPCERSALEVHDGGYSLGFVEFDDQGKGFDPGQETALFDHMAETGRRMPLAIVTFVHGWKHNAREDDGNVEQFRELLAAIARFETLKPAGERRAVVGVYAGWRGRTLTTPYLDALSFWNRKDAAHRVAEGSLRGLLGKLRAFRDVINLRAADPSQETRMVTIGHSFGGLIVYSALAQYFTDRAAASLIRARYFAGADANDHPREKADPREVSSYGDLVVVVNPAYEAIRYDPIRRLLDAAVVGTLPERFAPRQSPVLVQSTSVGDTVFEGDTATGIAFPIGRMANTMTEATRTDPVTGDNERRQIERAVGHYEPYWTHDLDLPQGHEMPRAEARAIDPAAVCRAFVQFERDARQPDGRLRPGWRRSYPSGAVLTEIGKGRYDPVNPFWIVRAHPSIILDHNDILRPVFVDVVAQLYGDIDRLKHPPHCDLNRQG